MVTITTRFSDFTKENVRMAQKLSARFLRALHYRGNQYVAVMALEGTIHYHIACKGERPSTAWVKKKWMRLSGCFEVAVTDAHEYTACYLIDNNTALLPNHKEGEHAWEGLGGNTFQRVRTSSRLFIKPPSRENGRYKRFHRSEEEIDALNDDMNKT